MKSKDALDYLHGTIDEKEFLNMTDLLPFHDAITAVEIAEADRDAKAVEAHRGCCHELRSNDICHAKFDKWDIHDSYLPRCNSECKYMNEFIQKLNEK